MKKRIPGVRALPYLIKRAVVSLFRIMVTVSTCFIWMHAGAQHNMNRSKTGNDSLLPANSPSISIGEMVPDLPLPIFLKNGGNKKSLADYQGKFLLIDFWATWCAPCYAKFPLMDSLQRKYNDRLQIIAISREKTDKVSAFLKKRNLDNVSFSVLTDDTVFNQVFQHYLIPHMIWVSPSGKVQYITGGKSLTSENFHQWLNGIPIHPLTKIDFMDYNTKVPILENVPYAKKSLRLTRNFYNRIPGLPGGSGIHRTDNSRRRFITNLSVWQMYGSALRFTVKYPYRQLRLNLKDTLPFAKQVPGEHWLNLHTYCYEVISPTDLNDTLFANLLLEDLNHNLGYQNYWEKNAGEAWVLYRMAKGKELKPSNHIIPIIKWQAAGKLLTMQCEAIGSFVDYLNRQPTSLSEPPIFYDKSGIDHHVDLSIVIKDADDFEALNQALKPYGLILKKERRISSQFVIADVH